MTRIYIALYDAITKHFDLSVNYDNFTYLGYSDRFDMELSNELLWFCRSMLGLYGET